jgi:hypothetical protein
MLRVTNSTVAVGSCHPLVIVARSAVCWGEDFPAFAAPTRESRKDPPMGRHSMNYQPEAIQPDPIQPEASIAPPGDPIDPGVPGAPQAPSPDGPSTVPADPGWPADPAQPAEPTQPSEPSWPVGPDGPEQPTGPGEPEPVHPSEPAPFAPEEVDDGTSAARDVWHPAGEEALR